MNFRRFPEAKLMPGSRDEGLYTVVYDGKCGVCRRSMKVLRRWDREDRLELLPSQSPEVRERFPDIPPEAFERSWQVVGPGGERWEGARALEEVLQALPRGRGLSWLFRIPLVRPLAERLYRWFARNRRRIGCSEHCGR